MRWMWIDRIVELVPRERMVAIKNVSLAEEHLRRGMLISHGDPMIFLQRPISAALLAASALVLIVIALPAVARKRDTVFVEDN